MNFDLPDALQLFLTVIGFVGLLAISSTYFIVKRYSEVIKLNKDTIDSYKESVTVKDHELRELRIEVKDLTAKLASLTGEVSVLRTIPLAAMTASLENIAKTQKDILLLLQSSSNVTFNVDSKTNNK